MSIEELAAKLTRLQHGTAMGVLKGMSQVAAYRQAGGTATNPVSEATCASEVLSHPQVKEFLAAVRAERLRDDIMDREEMLARLTLLARADMADLVDLDAFEYVDPLSGKTKRQTTWAIKTGAEADPLKLAAISELSVGTNGSKVKLHSQLQAMKQLADLQGWEMPKKTVVTGAGGGPIAIVAISTDDPAEAARAYLRMLNGGLAES